MPEKPLVFLSHSSSDKPRIGYIVDALVAGGYRVFIDHPELIDAKYTPSACAKWGVETLWSNDKTNWSDRLDEAMRTADCMLVIASQAISLKNREMEDASRRAAHKLEWLAEIARGDASNNLVFAKIESFSSDGIPSYYKFQDAINISQTLDDDPARAKNMLDTAMDILLNVRIPGAISRGKESRNALGGIADLLPLCVGRERQRDAISLQYKRLKDTGSPLPIVVVGPQNEIPSEFIRAISLHDDGTRTDHEFTIDYFDLPLERDDAFAPAFEMTIARELLRDVTSPLGTVIDEIRKGHPRILVSSFYTVGQPLAALPLREYVEFWQRLYVDYPQAPIVPILCIEMSRARPGWTNCPPVITEDRATYARNLEMWTYLEQNRCGFQVTTRPAGLFQRFAGWFGGRTLEPVAESVPPMPPIYALPQMTKPILQGQAATWVADIEIIREETRAALRREITNVLYADSPAATCGIDHDTFTKDLAAWLRTH